MRVKHHPQRPHIETANSLYSGSFAPHRRADLQAASLVPDSHRMLLSYWRTPERTLVNFRDGQRITSGALTVGDCPLTCFPSIVTNGAKPQKLSCRPIARLTSLHGDRSVAKILGVLITPRTLGIHLGQNMRIYPEGDPQKAHFRS